MISNFYGLNISFLDARSVALGIFGLVVLFVVVVSIIMFWHWQRYSIKKGDSLFVEVLYFTGVVIFASIAFGLLQQI